MYVLRDAYSGVAHCPAQPHRRRDRWWRPSRQRWAWWADGGPEATGWQHQSRQCHRTSPEIWNIVVTQSNSLLRVLTCRISWGVLKVCLGFTTIKVPERVRFWHENVQLSANHSLSWKKLSVIALEVYTFSCQNHTCSLRYFDGIGFYWRGMINDGSRSSNTLW